MIAFLRELMQPEWMFLRYALLVGALASLSLGVIGTMVVTRRISSLAGASAHAALGGVGVALFLQRVCMWTGFTPMLGAVIGAMAAALLVGVINLCAKEREDTIINVVWALFMSVGLLFLARTPGAIDLQSGGRWCWMWSFWRRRCSFTTIFWRCRLTRHSLSCAVSG